MGKYNYTNRLDLFWNVEESERDVMIMVNTLKREFYIVLDIKRIIKNLKLDHDSINEKDTNIFCEIFRGSFRKEIKLGTLTDPIFDNWSNTNNSLSMDPRIKRDLEDIDPNRVNFRIIVSDKKNRIVASSNSIKPFIIGSKEEISKIIATKYMPLFGTKISDDIVQPWDVGFENSGNKSKMEPVIYLNKKLDISSDCERDDRLLVAIFTFSFKELLRRCIVAEDVDENTHIQEFLAYAQSANTTELEDIKQSLEERYVIEDIYAEDVENFLDKALEKYIEDLDMLKKYQNAQENFNEKSDI